MVAPPHWTQIEEYLDARIGQEQLRIATLLSNDELRMAQGRLQALLELKRLPQAIATLTARETTPERPWWSLDLDRPKTE